MNSATKIQYVSAVLLIVSSIVLAFVQVFRIETVNDGTLMYIAQAFLLAGSIFGLDYYTRKVIIHGNQSSQRASSGASKQQSS